MRLIDADKLEDHTDDKYSLGEIGRYERDCITSALEYAPTIDAEPVKHGHLCSTDAYPHHLYCSECYKTLIPNEDICFEKNEFPKYCMWCGAKMDKEAEE